MKLPRPAESATAILWALRVLKPFRGLGLGAALLAEGEAHAAASGCRRAEIGVEKDNLRARMLYERLGYSPAGERKETYGYTTPDGYIRRATVDQWMLAKALS